MPATGAMVGTVKMSSTWAWRLPLLLQVIPPAIVMVCVWFCPESPRWLVSRGRQEEARAILVKYHSNDGQTNAVVELQLKEFAESIEKKNLEPFWDYSALVKDRNARAFYSCFLLAAVCVLMDVGCGIGWRLLCLTLMCVRTPTSYPPFPSHTTPLGERPTSRERAHHILHARHVPKRRCLFGTEAARLVRRAPFFRLLFVVTNKLTSASNFANSILSAFGAFSGASLTDRIGRRRRLYVGAFVLAVLLAMVAALSSECMFPHHIIHR